jgi:hypothetical protein
MSIVSVSKGRSRTRWGPIASRRLPTILPLCVVLSFLSAYLLFSVQPMVARMVLPRLGGSAAVWTTCILFFQGALLAGYAYAHLATRRLGTRRQAWLHAGLIAIPLAFLPFGIGGNAATATSSVGDPTWGLLGLLLASVGLPFFAVATSAPLLQRWLAATSEDDARDPYFLYAASNLGSMIALLAYPLLIEPNLGLKTQDRAWAALYAVWMVLTWAFAWRVGRTPDATRVEAPAAPVSPRQWASWVGLAFVPSSLLLGVTTYLSTDIATVPLLWVVPLALYLLTFIIAFARRPFPPHRWVVRATPVALVLLVLVLNIGPILRPELVPVHLMAFFLIALACHGELVRRRPEPGRLTSFYLALSLVGVLGGLFNAIVAPAIFKGTTEYPLMIAMAALAVPATAPRDRRWWVEYLVPWICGLAVIGLVAALPASCKGEAGSTPLRIVLGLGALLMFAQKDRPLRLAIVTGLVLAAGGLAHQDGLVIDRARSFFGASKVVLDTDGRFYRLRHGSTLHGIQATDPRLAREPLSYYHREGPTGQIFAMLDAEGRTPRRIALVGLGAGAITVHARPGQSWSIFEIDPEVVRIANDPRDFTYLRDCPARSVSIQLGDGRIGLADARDGSFDLVLLDAFSSDSVPVHLLTREALAVYRRKLAPGGLILVHISNRYFELAPVVGTLARDAGMACRYQKDVVRTPEQAREGKSGSAYAVLAGRDADLGGIVEDHRWKAPGDGPLWTDDHADVLRCLIGWR